MKLPRVFLALLLLTPTLLPAVAPDGGEPSRGAAIAFAPPERDITARASRSDAGFSPTTTSPPPTTTSTTTSTVPPTTAAAKKPVTTTAPRRAARPAAAAASAPLPTGGGNERVVQVALAQVGKQYRAGGNGPNAFDCSGLVYYVFNQAGIKVPRLTSDTFYSQYPKVSRSELLPGDLIVSRGHIGIYIGGGEQVHASTPRGGVKRSPMHSAGTPFGYARIPT